MCPRSIRKRYRKSLRLLLAGLCVFAHLGTTIGLPLPTLSQLDRAKPYPCQHHHCGCRSADQCWRSCCCMTMREKLAWARNHSVTTPEFVVLAAAEEAREALAPGCCGDHHERIGSCCSRHCQEVNQASTARGAENPTDQSETIGDSTTDGIDWVIGIHAQKCRGLTLMWITMGAIAPAPPSFEIPIDSTPPVPCTTLGPSLWASVALPPDVPPPRTS